MDTDSERLAWLLRRHDVSQTELAQQVGCTPQLVSAIISGRARISRNFAERLAEAFALNLDWLLRGEGVPEAEHMTTTTAPAWDRATVIIVPELCLCGRCKREVARGDEWCPTCGVELMWPEND